MHIDVITLSVYLKFSQNNAMRFNKQHIFSNLIVINVVFRLNMCSIPAPASNTYDLYSMILMISHGKL